MPMPHHGGQVTGVVLPCSCPGDGSPAPPASRVSSAVLSRWGPGPVLLSTVAEKEQGSLSGAHDPVGSFSDCWRWREGIISAPVPPHSRPVARSAGQLSHAHTLSRLIPATRASFTVLPGQGVGRAQSPKCCHLRDGASSPELSHLMRDGVSYA